MSQSTVLLSVRPFRIPLAWLALMGPVSAQTLNEHAKLLAGDAAAEDDFGASVSLSGDTVLVGARSDDLAGGLFGAGSACVFTRSGTTWTEEAQLVAGDAAPGDGFGLSVSLSGDTAVVGAERHGHGGLFEAGAAYVFVRSGTTWSQEAELLASDAAAGAWFGHDVAISGDTLLVGASSADLPGLPSAGAAYVFVRLGTAWIQQAKLVSSNPAPADLFGSSVALEGDTALVGAPPLWVIELPSAYVFVRNGGTWTQQAELAGSDTDFGDLFGSDVALSGDTALVTAASDDHSGLFNAGSAYVFTRSGTLWAEQAKLVAADAASGDELGTCALSGDTAILGAGSADGGIYDRGAAYVFTRSGAAWNQQAKLVGSDADEYSLFGSSVALSVGRAVIGALSDDACRGSSFNASAGSAYVYGPELVAPPPRLTAVNPTRIDALIPGTAQTIALTGTDLDRVTELLLDCAPVERTRYTIVGPTLITLDMPQVPQLGNHRLAVTDGTYTDARTVDVRIPFYPMYELGNGDPLNVVDRDDGLPFLLCRLPGNLLYLYASFSNVPSSSSWVSLDLGNQFTQLFRLGAYVIPSSGWLQVVVPASSLPDPGLVGLVFYSQAILFQPYPPFRASNLQSIQLVR